MTVLILNMNLPVLNMNLPDNRLVLLSFQRHLGCRDDKFRLRDHGVWFFLRGVLPEGNKINIFRIEQKPDISHVHSQRIVGRYRDQELSILHT